MNPDGLEGSSRFAGALRWGGAIVLVAGLHAGAGYWALTHQIVRSEPPDAPLGIMIDLEPVSVSQSAPLPSASLASGETATPQEAAQPEPAPEPTPRPAVTPEPVAPAPIAPPEPPPTEPPPAVQTPDPPMEAPKPLETPSVEQPPIETPPLSLPVQEQKSDAVLTPPQPKPKPAPQPKPKPDPRKLAEAAAAREVATKRREAVRKARAQAREQARAQHQAEARESGGQATQAASASSASSGASVSSWRGEVVAHLNAYKPPSPGGSGTVRIAFSVDRNGRVLSASLAGGSGDSALDEAALTMVRRASPVPPPPTEMGGRVNLTVPVRFTAR
ncbi:TonB family protein [Lichenihabitans sp. PAMC28606]|uniref:cell envelope integrity protein TolA n=1 Tax=Lichenihabitans sp. PAMC28606 TaxID=2880932 RepID=UPI001D09CA8E|nr:energy transducer TonB [Lichenihabitans sp. PAMC28606]UDL93579.1 TonB family protein [Lichenihabitans sp. PAMC28606]